MTSLQSDTIFALSSPAGRSGVAVIRITGPRALNALHALSGRSEFEPRKAVLCDLFESDDKNPSGRLLIDKALALVFKAPASFTGEDVVELYPHGSPAVVRAVLEALSGMDHLRMAEPGEFTRRAFENGKMDLTEAEAIGDLIHAETQMQRMQALSQMGGALSLLYNGWSENIKRMLAHLEADLEFPDEDMPEGILPTLLPDIKKLIDAMGLHLNDGHRGERLRDGIQVAVIGAPNAGKSSLVNLLAQRDVAIVSDMAGTTRDIIEVHLDLGGYPVILSDTAGLRPDQIGSDAHDKIESEGIRRALERAEQADLKILLFDGTADMADIHTQGLIDDQSIVVINKMDESDRVVFSFSDDVQPIYISAQVKKGIDQMLKALVEKISRLIGTREQPSLTRARHRQALERALAALERSLSPAALPELVAEDMRLAMREIGRITGRVDVEDLLDIIFKDFCIGK